MPLDTRYIDQAAHDKKDGNLQGLPVGTQVANDYGKFHRLAALYWSVSTTPPNEAPQHRVIPKGTFKALPQERRLNETITPETNIADIIKLLSFNRAFIISEGISAGKNPFRCGDSVDVAVKLAIAAENKILPDGDTNIKAITRAVHQVMNTIEVESPAPLPVLAEPASA